MCRSYYYIVCFSFFFSPSLSRSENKKKKVVVVKTYNLYRLLTFSRERAPRVYSLREKKTRSRFEDLIRSREMEERDVKFEFHLLQNLIIAHSRRAQAQFKSSQKKKRKSPAKYLISIHIVPATSARDERWDGGRVENFSNFTPINSIQLPRTSERVSDSIEALELRSKTHDRASFAPSPSSSM